MNWIEVEAQERQGQGAQSRRAQRRADHQAAMAEDIAIEALERVLLGSRCGGGGIQQADQGRQEAQV